MVLICASTGRARRRRVRVASDLSEATRELLVGAINLCNLQCHAFLGRGGFSQALLIRDVEGIGQASDALDIFISSLSETAVATEAAILTAVWCARSNLLRGKFYCKLCAGGQDHLRLNGLRG